MFLYVKNFQFKLKNILNIYKVIINKELKQ
jgi:hypothetical protein